MEINHVSMANMKWFGCIAVNLNEGEHLEWNFGEENWLKFIKKIYNFEEPHKQTWTVFEVMQQHTFAS